MKDSKILVTGATGQVAWEVVQHFNEDNEVWATARFNDENKRKILEDSGVHCVAIDLASNDFSALPTDFDYVLNFAVSKDSATDFDAELNANAISVGMLMQHCKDAKAFLHCSSCGVYEECGEEAVTESSPLGANHKALLPIYSHSKNAQEAVVRFAAKAFNLPSIICRLNVPYGNTGGFPFWHLCMMESGDPITLLEGSTNTYGVIHNDDIIRTIEPLLNAATVPVEIVNWSGEEHVSIEQWCAYITELTGLEAKFERSTQMLPTIKADVTKLLGITGPMTVNWKDGIRRQIETLRPDLLLSTQAAAE